MCSKYFGKVIAFLGPDGAGKSSVLNLVQKRLTEQRDDFQYYYFAPGFLKRYRPKGDKSITTNPHEGRQYGSMLVLAKILLMLLEFRMGIPKVRRKTRLALFDRYIHDLLVDPRRYRMDHMRWWMRMLLATAPKPDLLVVIIAPTETIQARKQEVTPEETSRQIAAYEALAKSMPTALVVNNSGTIEEAAEAVLECLEELK